MAGSVSAYVELSQPKKYSGVLPSSLLEDRIRFGKKDRGRYLDMREFNYVRSIVEEKLGGKYETKGSWVVDVLPFLLCREKKEALEELEKYGFDAAPLRMAAAEYEEAIKNVFGIDLSQIDDKTLLAVEETDTYYSEVWGDIIVVGPPKVIEKLAEGCSADQHSGGLTLRRKRYNPKTRSFETVEYKFYMVERTFNSKIPVGIRVPRGLLPKLIAIAKNKGFNTSYLEAIRFKKTEGKIKPENITVPLRPYQVEAVKSVLRQVEMVGDATLMAATGSGKTEIGIALLQALSVSPQNPALIVVPTRDLVYQWRDRLAQYGVKANIAFGDTLELEEGAGVTITTIASGYRVAHGLYEERKRMLQERLGKEEEAGEEESEEEEEVEEEREVGSDVHTHLISLLKNAYTVLFDEVHHMPAKTVKTIARVASNAARIGLSATPWRNDELDLVIYAHTGAIVDRRITSSELIDEGYLVKPYIFRLRTGLTGTYTNWRQEKSAVLKDPKRVELVAELAKILPAPVLILTEEKEPGELVHDALKKAGVKAEFIYGMVDAEERNRVLNDLRAKRIDALVATTLADEGLDLPAVASLILYSGGKSNTKIFQRIGRALRKAEGKNYAIVVDLVDGTSYMGRHAEARAKLYATEERWTVENVKDIEELKSKLISLKLKSEEELEKKKKELAASTELMKGKGWSLITQPVTVIAPHASPKMASPVFYKTWRFGPFQVHAYSSSGEQVWLYKRGKVPIGS